MTRYNHKIIGASSDGGMRFEPPPFQLNRDGLFWARCSKCLGWMIAPSSEPTGEMTKCKDCQYSRHSLHFAGNGGNPQVESTEWRYHGGRFNQGEW